jgi:hypothetical protein
MQVCAMVSRGSSETVKLYLDEEAAYAALCEVSRPWAAFVTFAAFTLFYTSIAAALALRPVVGTSWTTKRPSRAASGWFCKQF